MRQADPLTSAARFAVEAGRLLGLLGILYAWSGARDAATRIMRRDRLKF